tara:strand:+ start:285 stop:602 length:318 start_codon:yes stop_codon:yes gene_type:complete
METWGLYVFLLTAIVSYVGIFQEKKQLAIDRRSLQRRAVEVLEIERQYKLQEAESNKGFDLNKHLPMLLHFLGGRGVDTSQLGELDLSNIDLNELQGLLPQEDKK